MATFVDTLVNMLSGAAQAQGNAPQGNVPQAPAPRMPNRAQMAPMAVPASRVPVPTPRPSLPGGSFAPNRNRAAPAPVDIPEPQQQNPLMALLAGGGAGGDWRKMVRAAGSGMSNIGNTGGDPFLAFGRGFGGATGHYDEKEAAEAEAAAAAEQTTYDRSQDAADLELRQAAEARQASRTDMANKKTAAELSRMAKQNGLTVSQMLEIERIAQAAGETEYDPKRRREVVEQERTRLMEQFGADGKDTREGLSGDSGGLSDDDVTATGPDGEKLILRNGQWEPMNGT